MKENSRQTNPGLWLTVPIALLLAIAAGGGVFIGDLYRDSAYLTAQAVGQDFISLFIVLPILIVTAFLAGRGSVRALLTWLGILVYLVYTYAIAAFAIRFNSFFLVYVALLGFSLYGLIAGLATADLSKIKSGFTERTPVKVISLYLAALVIVFYFLWLSEVIPALLLGNIPQSIQDNGTPTNFVHVLDMAWILPAFGIAAVSLWRKQALGYTLAGTLLSYTVLLILAILSMILVMNQRGQPIILPQAVIFVTLFIISLGMLVSYLRGTTSRMS
jgi:hypothetical protein